MFPNGVFLNDLKARRLGGASFAWILPGTALMTALFAFPIAGSGQERGGVMATIGVSQAIVWSDNADLVGGNAHDDSLRAVTGLSFGLTSETRNQRFDLNARTGLETVISGPGDSEVSDPRVTLGYRLENRNNLLSLRFGFVSSQVGAGSGSEDNSGTLVDNDVVEQSGTQTDYSASGQWEFGREALFGGSLSYRRERRTYDGVNPASYFDTETDSLSASLRFDVTPRVQVTTSAGVTRYERDDTDDTKRLSKQFSVGTRLQIDDTTTLSLSVSRDNSETERLSGTTQTSGFGYDIKAVRDLKRGAVSASLSSRETLAGRRTELLLSQNVALNGGQLSYGVGMLKFADTAARPTARLNYRYELRSGVASLGLEQTPGIRNDDVATLTTRLSGSYSYDINSVSALSTEASFVNRAVIGVDGEDQRRMELSLRYTHKLGSEWNLVGAYNHTRINEEGSDQRARNRLSVSVERSFDFRP